MTPACALMLFCSQSSTLTSSPQSNQLPPRVSRASWMCSAHCAHLGSVAQWRRHREALLPNPNPCCLFWKQLHFFPCSAVETDRLLFAALSASFDEQVSCSSTKHLLTTRSWLQCLTLRRQGGDCALRERRQPGQQAWNQVRLPEPLAQGSVLPAASRVQQGVC